MKRELIDVNVSLGQWPTRRVHGDEPRDLVRLLKAHNVTEAWAGSLEGLLHKDVAAVNERLAESCREHGRNILKPIGTINPTLPHWQDDIRRCAEDHGMRGIRLHPNYHGYTLDDPRFENLLSAAAEAELFVQIAVTMEDERMMHPQLRVPHVDTAPLVYIKTPANIMLLNAFRAVRGAVLEKLVDHTNALFDIAWIEGLAGIERILKTIPANRLLFGTHAPLFYYDAALLKLQESQLTDEQRDAIKFKNAQTSIPEN
jgi:predicted TIM-barrel fold metal-dependent hydrolase